MARHELPRTKTPTEKFRIAVDFKNDIKVGDARASQIVTAKRLDTDASDPTFIGTVAPSGSVVEVVIQNGAAGVDDAVTIQITTTQGDIFEGVVIVPVRAN